MTNWLHFIETLIENEIKWVLWANGETKATRYTIIGIGKIKFHQGKKRKKGRIEEDEITNEINIILDNETQCSASGFSSFAVITLNEDIESKAGRKTD